MFEFLLGWPAEMWLSFAVAVAIVGQLFVAFKMWQFEQRLERERKEVFIDVFPAEKIGSEFALYNASHTGVHIKALKIDVRRHKTGQTESITNIGAQTVHAWSNGKLVFSEALGRIFNRFKENPAGTVKPSETFDASILIKYLAHGRQHDIELKFGMTFTRSGPAFYPEELGPPADLD